jgi:hypothetical protein
VRRPHPSAELMMDDPETNTPASLPIPPSCQSFHVLTHTHTPPIYPLPFKNKNQQPPAAAKPAAPQASRPKVGSPVKAAGVAKKK